MKPIDKKILIARRAVGRFANAGPVSPRSPFGFFISYAMLKHIFQDYKDLGLRAIPFQWDIENNIPKYQKEGWSNPQTKFELLPTDNALQIVTGNGWAALDFDLKNTSNKKLFDQWVSRH